MATLGMLQERFGFECRGRIDLDAAVKKIRALKDATPHDLSFLINERYVSDAQQSKALAIIVHPRAEALFATERPLILSTNPHALYARIASFLYQRPKPFEGISSQAFIDPRAQMGSHVTVMPFAFVGPDAQIGSHTVLYPGTYVGARAQVGEHCTLLPHSVLMDDCIMGDGCVLNPGAVVGGDGFGFAQDGAENIKIPQEGRVVLGDQVELGANATVDRGSAQDTEIGKHTKIDNLVQVAHNVVVGESCFLASQAGIAGSTQVGNKVTLAGQVGVGGHLTICDEVLVLGQAGVTKSIRQKGVYNGTPARPNKDHLKQQATLNKIAAQKDTP